jgi:hypothetical protein
LIEEAMLELTRQSDWTARYVMMTYYHRNTVPEWGKSDCLLASMDIVHAVTGVDPVADIRGQYDSELGAAKLLVERGYEGSVEIAIERNFPEIGILTAQRGDLGIIDVNKQATLGWITEYGFAFKQPRGLDFAPQSAIRRAFKVG